MNGFHGGEGVIGQDGLNAVMPRFGERPPLIVARSPVEDRFEAP